MNIEDWVNSSPAHGRKGGNPCTTNKMVTNKSLAAELLNKITNNDHLESITPLEAESALSLDMIRNIRHSVGGRYKLDNSNFCTRVGNVKPTGMFEQFAKHCGKSAELVRSDLIDYLWKNIDDCKSLAKEVLNMTLHHVDDTPTSTRR